MSRLRIGLALGGGAARGLAHVGVLQVLEREEIPVDCIAGTSVGALVGAAYAAGIRGERLRQLALGMRWHKIARLVWPRDGFVSFAKMERYLLSLVGDLTFDDLTLPFAAVASELATGEAVVLRQGQVAPAVRASCSVPGVVIPVEWQGCLLADGCATNNLPISVARELGADRVIAVGLMAPPGHKPRGLLQIALAAIESLILRSGDDPAGADAYIRVPLSGLASLVRLSAAEELMALGQRATEAALPAILALLE